MERDCASPRPGKLQLPSLQSETGGGAAAYVQGVQFDQLLAKGRWQHIATARLYLDQALQEYTALVLPQAVTRKVRAASQRFAAELGRVEEGARRT